MPVIPWWALLSSGCAPFVLIGGWVVAATLQPSGYNPINQTISTLAAHGAADRWVMTWALLGLGACHLVSALGLRPAAPIGRVVLALGGFACFAVALFPEPDSGATFQHTTSTTVGFIALALWPSMAARRGAAWPWPLRTTPAISVTALLFGGAVWFLDVLHHHGPIGASERVLTTAQAVWPLVVALACVSRAARRRAERGNIAPNG
jgi:hypothetical membrane protein